MLPEYLGPLALGILIGGLAVLSTIYFYVEIDFIGENFMPVDWSKYPDNWDVIAFGIKEEADWQCECCGKQCRRPGEPFDTHKRETLTVAHCNHVESDCRPENLSAMCAPCHLRYDASHHAENASKTRLENWKKRNKNQLQLFPGYSANETDLSALQQ